VASQVEGAGQQASQRVDHWIVVGRVENIRTSPVDDPLVFFAGAFGGLQ
jgi:hypothetical protein